MTSSVFDIIGPAMIGPSSSHTAGAVRLGLLTHFIANARPRPDKIIIGLHGSFAATGRGHATDRGLVAGLMGFRPDDTRLKDAIDIAKEQGLKIEFENIDLGPDAHPNSARITFCFPEPEPPLTVIGASIGGGNVEIQEISGFETSITGALDSVILWHKDQAGFLARVTGLIACVEVNIASILTGRKMRNSDALTVIKTDAPLPEDCLSVLNRISQVVHAIQIPKIA